ncbi:hypothetical protein XA68_16718 [Ophiocordyceps unilateralis]|uniref:S-formylglutathione hydrolase n=1 Tax=Ophiocordyceps unilateralis TaxID=268505 RepID=A0A2A9P4A8_OPHUN|nr:hypothetical protein XA68_16718 [Ophiocordyceps unilateralis]
MAFTTDATIATFGGRLLKLRHQSSSTSTPMELNLFIPPSAKASSPAPLLIYLSGLSCTPNNATEKAALQAHASPLGLALLFPDTSPRGTDIPGQDEDWDFGVAASFYLDAVVEPWSAHYRMETYLTQELPRLLFDTYPELAKDRVSIAGHSMGGHGALTLFLRHPGMYRSVSAWSPVANPCLCPWGEKAFRGYLGDDKSRWKEHDATELLKTWDKGSPLNCLIDVGTNDNFYKQGQLLPENFEKAVKEAGIEGVKVRYHEGYDHSYYFISTFGADHVKHAAKSLGLL